MLRSIYFFYGLQGIESIVEAVCFADGETVLLCLIGGISASCQKDKGKNEKTKDSFHHTDSFAPMCLLFLCVVLYAGGGNHLKRRSFPPPAPPPSLALAKSLCIIRRSQGDKGEVCLSAGINVAMLEGEKKLRRLRWFFSPSRGSSRAWPVYFKISVLHYVTHHYNTIFHFRPFLMCEYEKNFP